MKHASRCCLAILASHPIQYFTPLYRALAAVPWLDVEVLYCRDFGVRERFDKQFGRAIRWDTDQLSGYRFRFLWNVSPVSDPFNPLHAINPGALLRTLIGRYDVLWVNGYLYPSNWLAIAAAAGRGIPVLGRSELRLDSRLRPRRLDAVRKRVIRMWIRRCRALLYIGRANREAYIAYGAPDEKLFFCPYSTDIEGIRTLSCKAEGERASLRRRCGIPEDAIVALYVGKLIPRKHPEVMLELAERGATVDRLHVVIAGSGPMESALRDAARSRGLARASFLGFVNQRELPSVYAMADIFVMPSEREPWGLVLNEAMAVGLAPVVSTDVGAAADLIVPGETGFTFTVPDWNAMMERVLWLARDHALRRRIAGAARRHVEQYGVEASVSGVLRALRAVGAGQRAPDAS